MDQDRKLNHPWLIAVWPGMGHVAISAGYYVMAKLEMHLLAEFSPRELFDIEHVEVKDGLIHTAGLPRNRFFAWTDPANQHDLVVFIGEAQPPRGKYAFCCQLIRYAQQLGVERVFTFAAMATQMHPEHSPRVFGAATDDANLRELKRLELEILEDGHIGGLNGLLLGAASDLGMHGACLLGEMPHILAQLAFPKASLAVLETFATLANIEIDLTELADQARAVDQQVGELLSRVQRAMSGEEAEEESEFDVAEPNQLRPQDEQRIERLFEESRHDRSKAYELKRELDRLNMFADYEERFLDLFKKPEP
ncbi:MAG: PAC2 family protein [Planctomycetaceae bacterium]